MEEEYKYVYKNPLEQGYTQFKITKKEHNELFQYRKKTWVNKFEYYYKNNHIIIHQFVNPLAIIFSVIAFPVFILIHGFGNIKELLKEYKGLFNQKKYGSFSGDDIWSKSEIYDKVMKIIKENE